MNNHRWISGVLALGTFALVGYGCSSDTVDGDDDVADSGATSSSSGAQASSSSGQNASSSSSSGDVPDAAAACFVAEEAVGYSTKTQLAHSGDCTTEQLEAFNTACFAEGSTGDTCTAFSEAPANVACDACISGNGPEETRVTGIFGGGGEISTVCAANVAGNPEECGSKADNKLFCMNQACNACEDEASFDACLEQAAVSPQCAAFEPAVDCEALFATQAAAITATCGDLDIQNPETVLLHAAYLCGITR